MQRLECHNKSVSGALYKAILFHGQSAGKEMANSAVFNFRRISLTEVGREFQACDAAAGHYTRKIARVTIKTDQIYLVRCHKQQSFFHKLLKHRY